MIYSPDKGSETTGRQPASTQETHNKVMALDSSLSSMTNEVRGTLESM